MDWSWWWPVTSSFSSLLETYRAVTFCPYDRTSKDRTLPPINLLHAWDSISCQRSPFQVDRQFKPYHINMHGTAEKYIQRYPCHPCSVSFLLFLPSFQLQSNISRLFSTVPSSVSHSFPSSSGQCMIVFKTLFGPDVILVIQRKDF